MLRHDKIYGVGRSKWTQAHFRWLERVKFEIPVQQIVFEEYVDTVKQAQLRVAGLEEQMRQAMVDWQLSPVVEALMAYLGQVPSEYSSGKTRGAAGPSPRLATAMCGGY